jgi:hypothetical protein
MHAKRTKNKLHVDTWNGLHYLNQEMLELTEQIKETCIEIPALQEIG